VLLPFVGYAVSYTVTYAAGTIPAYYLSARFVFRRPLQWRHSIQYPLVYVLQYGLGITLTTAFIEGVHLNAEFAAALAIVITVPFTFTAEPMDHQAQGTPGPSLNPAGTRRNVSGK
jgi:putative flippase GtrA